MKAVDGMIFCGSFDMVRNNKRIFCGAGFTLIEMLVTLAIIALIIGMLMPAFNAVRKAAVELRQKAQFSNIEMGLEGYRADFSDYPESGPKLTNEEFFYTGAQKLAEALVGQDGFGVHKKTEFRLDGLADLDSDDSYTAVDEFLYDITAGNLYETAAENKAARRGPYLELESANAVRLGGLFKTAQSAMKPSFVLGDMFGLVKNLDSSKKSGLPVLYYKANTAMTSHFDSGSWSTDQYIYTISDNRGMLTLALPFSDGRVSPLADGANVKAFYDAIANPNFGTGAGARPYRAESFILQSAGADGMYGTGDDVFNFDSGN